MFPGLHLPMSTTALNHSQLTDENAFHEWLAKSRYPFRAAIKRKHGQYYMLAIDFNVAGAGRTRSEAQRDLARLLQAYFQSYFKEGRPLQDAVRPVGWRTRLAIALGTLVWQRLGSAPHECSDCGDDLSDALLGHAA